MSDDSESPPKEEQTTDTESEKIVDDGSRGDTATDVVNLPLGDDWRTDDAAKHVAAHRRCTWILVVGAQRAGKTTLAGALYQQFLLSSFAGFEFAGSETLVGFEKRCHFLTTGSRLPRPDMRRTSYQEQTKILHIRVKCLQSGKLHDLMFMDMSGEYYEAAAGSDDDCREVNLWKAADQVIFLLDGKNLADLSKRHQAVGDSGQLLRRCADLNLLTSLSNVDVLANKQDEIDRADDDGEASAFTGEFLEELDETYSDRFARFRTHRVALMPETFGRDYGLLHGVDKLFPTWVRARREFPRMKLGTQSSTRVFDRFRCTSRQVKLAND